MLTENIANLNFDQMMALEGKSGNHQSHQSPSSGEQIQPDKVESF